MAEIVKIDTLFGGVRLHRHYNQNENPEIACGKLDLWNQIIKEINTGSFEYYWPNATENKFYKHIEIHCYSQSLTYPDANSVPGMVAGQVTYNLGNGNSKITCPYSDPAQYWFKAAMSHEFGHCYHNWVRMFEGGPLADVRRWWDHEITIDKVYFDPNRFPWRQKDGSLQNDFEQFANSFRILFGTVGTRGVLELVPEGMHATTTIPDIQKKLRILPELCAMATAYGGVVANTLQWSNGGFLFQIPGGYWIWQTDYNIWQWNKQDWLGNWSGWKQFYPSYSRD